MQDIKIRYVVAEDAKALLEIYSHYVLNTAISFEYDVPLEDEFRKRIETTLCKYPYLVLESGGEIKGYAYAGPFKTREAYKYSVENTGFFIVITKKISAKNIEIALNK